MSVCWYCYWGWSQAVADIYHRYLPIAGEAAMEYGPAHIVWADENFSRRSVQWCLDNFDDYRDAGSEEELAAVRQSLVDMLALPDEVRDPQPKEYDGQDPDRYPPPRHVEMVYDRGRRENE